MASPSQMMYLYTVLLLFAIQIFPGDATRAPEICGRTKCNAGGLGKFKYTVGTVYRYYHKVDVSLNLGNGSSTSDLHIESVVSIKFATPCEADLRISKASIRHATRGKYDAEFPDRAEAEFKEKLERYNLRFAFEDGHVHELCPNSNDAIWAVNIKRGILSMFQNTMKRFDVDHRAQELDVNGICDTRYRLHEARKTSLILFKTKDLYGCTNRGKHLSIIQSNVYASPPQRSQTSLLNSKISCEIVIDHNIYEKVTCEETHLLQPLSNGDAAVKANTFSSLVLIEESTTDDDEINERNDDNEDDDDDDDNDTENNNKSDENNEDQLGKSKSTETIPTNLLYDHSAAAFSSRTVHGELRTSRDLLKSMCSLGTSGMLEQSFSEAFSKFVHSARLLDYPSLSQFLVRANGICHGGRTYILDALPFIGTSASIKVMRDAILKKTVDRERSDSWMTAIALAPRPDFSTVAALLPLLESDRQIHYGQFTLVYSAVVRAFCLNAASKMAGQRTRSNFLHEDNCLAIKGTGIHQFLDHLETTIEQGCEPRPHDLQDIKKTLEALKAIGNMGLEREGLSQKLQKCIDNTGGFISMETRVAAIDAHRRLPSCQETRDRIFLPRYRNVTLEPEIRIASYLQAMRCPDYNVVKTIKLALKEEPINQVGSFVWSHLTNLLASSSPTRIEIQSLLTDRDISDKFNSDARKYSRNYEKSFFSEEYNVGGTFQANVIFSSKSYVPRTITFNVSLDLFGESVNILEATVRMEGMEYYAEKFFGPNGPLANEKISRHIISFLRSLRSADEAKNYWEALKTLPNVIDNNFDDPRVSISYKIFGNELEFMMLRGPDEIAKSLAALDPWQKMKRILSGKEIHYEHTGMFLDASYVVPSTTGLPVRLDLVGSAACNFKFSGLLDSERLIKDTEMELIGNLAPSVSVAITGKMTVDAFYKSAAIKLRSNIYSSSAARLRLDIKGMKLVRLNLELPNRKLEVFTIRSDIVLVNGNGPEISESPAIPPKIIPMKYGTISNSTCSWPVMERLIGLKLCFDYQFPNVTEVANASYFFLNGPTLFRTSIIKADPSAESYLFEYSWNATATDSILKLAFDTPGSQVNRESSVTVMFDAPNRNVSVLLRSAGNSLVAKGTYKRTDDETMINVGLDVNGTKHLDGYIGYARKRGNFGFTYTPKLELRINNEIVVELSGTIRDAHKNNVSHCDIDLNFRTKKITSRVTGYIMRHNISITGNVKVEYQLRNMKKETLQIEISLANHSSKTLTHKKANLKLQSSAYPQLNAIIETWYQQALGHLELHAEINTKPHLKDKRHKLTAQLVLTYSKAYFQSQEAKMNAFIAVSKPIQNLDIKVGVQRFSVGPSSKTFFLIRYAPGKEISLAINIVMPRSSMLAIEGHANMTIPNFDSMLIDVRVNEKARGEYDLDFAGTWFSGHNATIRGTYADRSSIIGERCITSHNLKLILRSPSLARDILLNCKLYRDHVDTKFDIDVEYLDADKYALKLAHSIISLSQFISHAEARYKNNAYAVTANVDVEREVRLELHLDNWRDIHLIATGINEDTRKELGFEIKWDANRDPALKFATHFQLNKFFEDEPLMSRNYSAAVMITYPGRLFTGSCLVGVVNGHNYILDARIDWDQMKTIRFAIDADYDVINWKNYFKFDSRLLTPFEQWKKTSLTARYHWTGEELTANCDAHWQDDQQFLIQFSASVQDAVDTIEWRANCGLTSTVHSIGWINANLTHKVIRQSSDMTADSRLLVTYNPDKIIDIKSIWHINGPSKPDDNITLAGNLRFISPLTNYRNGDIKCQLRLMKDWKFDGITNIEMDKRKYTGVLCGDLSHIRESMVEFNVTTPLEKYSFLRGRFGLSEQNKHAVAEIILPSGPIGIEVLCRLFSSATYDFDVMLRISTHIEVLQRFLVVAKLAKTEADFRLAYNNATAGVKAIWHYNNLTDFHYSYVLYTPIHGLHESGIVAKLIILDSESARTNWLAGIIDTEFSIRIVETKFGIKAEAGPKFSPLQMLDEKLVESSFEPEDDDFNWRGDVEVNAAIIEPIVGFLDLDKRGPVYQIGGFLSIPQGVITVDDQFIIVDFFDMKNTLELKTPFASLAELYYTYTFNIDLDTGVYLLEMDLNVNKNDSTPRIENSLKINYTYSEGEEDDSQTHITYLTLKTPKAFVGDIIFYGFLEFDETIYKTNITLRMNESQADLFGSLEMEEAFLDGSFTVYINSTALKIPKTKINIKKDFADVEKRLECGIQMVEIEKNKCKFHAVWNIESSDHNKILVGIETWIEPLQLIEIDYIYNNNLSLNQSLEIEAKITHFPEQKYKLSGAFRPNRTIDIELHGPPNVQGFDYRFDGILDESNKLTGRLINLQTSKIYLVDSKMKILTRQYKVAKIDGLITIIQQTEKKDEKESEQHHVTFTFYRERTELRLNIGSNIVNGSASLKYINALNWDTKINVEYPELGLNGEINRKEYEIEAFTNVQVNSNTTIYLNAKSPWNTFENLRLDGNIMLDKDGGNVMIKQYLNNDNGHMNIAWKLAFLEDMLLKINGATNDKDVDIQFYLKNPRRAFRNINCGFDINIDHEFWRCSTNLSVGYRNKENVDGILTVRLPPPNNDDHRVVLIYHANKGLQDATFTVGYNAAKAMINYASDGSVCTII
ncbi:hypothetical protein PV326_004381 [Microctonus aethiopoides]|nr:hypothetical protein PV326_004381 [Microctonus aethiopoides]